MKDDNEQAFKCAACRHWFFRDVREDPVGRIHYCSRKCSNKVWVAKSNAAATRAKLRASAIGKLSWLAKKEAPYSSI